MIIREIEGFSEPQAPTAAPIEMIIRLHNDDIHSYDDVISALSEIQLPLAEAEQKTAAVDRAGYAIVKRLSDPVQISSDWGILAEKASLLVSVIPSELASLEESVSATWVWLHHITAKHVGLLRLLTLAFVEPIDALYSRTDPVLILSSDLPPLTYPHLPLRHREPSSPPFEVLLPSGVDGTSPGGSGHVSVHRLTPFSPEFKNSTPLTLLSLMIASSPYLVKEWQTLLHDLVIIGLKDLSFKSLYSQLLLHLYPHLSALFCHGIGTDKESLFHTTVQIYSTESIVSMLSSEGYLSRSRPCEEPTLQGELEGQRPDPASFSLIPVLISCFNVFLESSGIFESSEEQVLSSFSFRNQRYRNLLHDLDFAMTCGNQHKEFFLSRDANGKSPFNIWLDILCKLNSLKPFTRIPAGRPHALYEDSTWQEALSLIVEVETVSSSVVSHSLSPKSTADPSSMSLIFSTALASLLEKLDELYHATQGSFIPATNPSSAFPFEWQTCFNITSGTPVTIFTPLGRFLALLLRSASAWSLPYSIDQFRPLSIPKMRGISIACDYAIRNLSFASQVECELWKRNGLSALNLIYNYNRPPLCKFFRDLDLAVIQLGVVLVGPDLVLSNLLRAFECSLVESVHVRKLKYSTRALMLRELLRWLILIVTYLPHDLASSSSKRRSGEDEESKMDFPPPSEDVREGLELSVDRLVAHLLLSGKSSKGKLQTVKGLLRQDTQIGDDEINASVDRLCQVKSSQLDSESAVTLEPKPLEVLKLFDPEHPYLQTKELHLANEKARSYRSKPEISAALSSASAVVPMQRPPPQRSAPPPLPVVFAAALPTPHPEFIVVRQLLSSSSFMDLMLTALALPSNTEIVNLSSTKDEWKIRRSTILSIVSRCVHLLTIQLHSVEGDLAGEWNRFPSRWMALLPLLASIHRSDLLTEDPLYVQGLDWLLREYCWRCDAALHVLVAENYDGALEIEGHRNQSHLKESSAAVDEVTDAAIAAESAMEKRKLEARRRAMAAMQKNANAFSAQLEAAEEGDEEEGLEKERKGREHLPDCIICRGHIDSPVGYFMHIQPSRVLHRAISQGPESTAGKLYLVIRPSSAYAAPVDSATPRPSPIFSLAPGDVIEITERTLISWVRFSAPRGEGWAEIFQTVASEAELSKQAPPRVQMISLDLLTHSRHGAVRPFVSTCGHGLHLECWSNFLFTNMQQQQSQPHLSELSAESGEVACPLCKTVANGILPCHRPLLNPDHSSCCSSPSGGTPQLPIHSHTIDSELFLDWNPPENSDVYPAYDILVADHCLSRSQLQSQKKPTIGASGDVGKNITSLRQLQALWSAVGYSLLSAVSNAKPNTATGRDALPLQDHSLMLRSPMLAIDQLFRCAQRAREWLSTEFNYREVVLSPLRGLLFSAQPCPVKLPAKCAIEELNVDAVTHFLSLQPLPVVFDSICPEDSKTLQKSFEKVQAHGLSDTKSMWPFLLQPLLSQDLHVIAIAVTSNCRSLVEALHLSSLLCLARLCQILLEPIGTGRQVEVRHRDETATGVGSKKRARLPSDPIDCSFREGDLDRLRDRLCGTAGVSWRGSVDESLVQDSWLPFLKFSCSLRNLLTYQASLASEPSGAMQGHPSPAAAGEDGPVLLQLLHTCGLGELVLGGGAAEPAISLEGALLEKLSAVWGAQYREYYQQPVVPAAPPDQDIAQPTTEEKEAHSEEDDDLAWVERPLEEGEREEEEDSEEDESDEEDEEGIGEVDMAGFDDELLELANDPALVLPQGQQQEVDVLDMHDWLLQTGLDMDSEEIQQLLSVLDSRNPSRGSLLCGVDPVETPFRPAPSRAPLDTVPPLVGSVSGVSPYFDSAQQHRLSTLLFDNSHLGLGQRHSVKLFDLPQKYTDLYQMAKFPAFLGGAKPIDNPAVCLVCGQILSAGNRQGMTSRVFLSGPGECTLHAIECGAGIGMFFLVERCQTLLLSGPRAVYSPSLYLDSYGECSAGHNRPLYLSHARHQRLLTLYTSHEIAKEVVRVRLGGRSVIRLNYF